MARSYIGQRLRTARKKFALTQQELADYLGVHRRSVQDWEADRTAVDDLKAGAVLARVDELVKSKGRKP